MNIAELLVRFRGDTSELQAASREASNSLGQMGSRLESIGQRLTIGLTAPLAAIGGASVKMASDAAESASKFDVVMGDAAEGVRAALEGLHAVVPLTTGEMESLAAGVQAMLVPMGVARERGAEMSAEMVRLAGDMAAFNNASPEEVLLAMQSALAGSSEPMRRFGVDTREAAVQAVALEAGLIAEGEAMDMATRAQAVLLKIQRDSADATGYAALEADSAAATFAFFSREVKQLSEVLGAQLLPAVTSVIRFTNDLLERFRDMSPASQKVVVALGTLAAATGPILFALGKLVTLLPAISTGFALLTGPIGLAAGALVAAGIAWAKWGDDITRIVANVVAAVADFSKDVAKRLEWLTGPVGTVLKAFLEFGKALTKLMADLTTFVVGKAAEIVSGLFHWLQDKLAPIGRAVWTVIEPVIGFFTDLGRNVIRIVEDIVSRVWDVFTAGLKRVADGVAHSLGWITDKFEWMSNVLVGNSIVPDMVTLIKAEFDGLSDHMILTTMEAAERTTEEFSRIEASFSETMDKTWSAIDNAVSRWADDLPDAVKNVVGRVSEEWGKVRAALELKEVLTETWKDWLRFANDFVASIKSIWNSIGTILSKIADVFRGPKAGPNAGYMGGGVPFYAPPGSVPAYSMASGIAADSVASAAAVQPAPGGNVTIENHITVDGHLGTREQARTVVAWLVDEIDAQLGGRNYGAMLATGSLQL